MSKDAFIILIQAGHVEQARELSASLGTGLDLSGADLRGADLRGVCLLYTSPSPRD